MVVVSGCGVVSPLGTGVSAFRDGLFAGRSSLAPLVTIDATDLVHPRGGEVTDWRPEDHLSADERERFDRGEGYAIAAVREALRDAGLRPEEWDASRVGLTLATTLGGIETGEAWVEARVAGRDFPSPRRLLHVPYPAVAGRVARLLGVRGPVASPSIACASGTDTIATGVEWIRAGRADVVFAGGVERMCRYVVSGFDCLRATTADAVRPFDRRRNGLLVGEGAAIVVLERAEHARARGAAADVEVAGIGLSGDAVHMTAPARDGAGAARAMRAALRDAGLAPGDVDYVSAHGTGTVYNDAMEIAAFGTVFGEGVGRVVVSGIKGAIGHTLGAAGTFEAVQCVVGIREGRIPPTIGCEEPDPAVGFDLVTRETRRLDLRVALSTSSAFAGNNAAVVLRRVAA